MSFVGPIDVPNLLTSVSADRFETYLRAVGGDRSHALALYELNSDLCAAFYTPLQTVEVALRNSCHVQLQIAFGDNWPREPRFLGIDNRLHGTVARAVDRVRNARKPVDVPHVVAALSFGFWTTMLSKHLQNTLWAPAICHAFPNYHAITARPITRPIAAHRFDEIRSFRNRVFHHEPIVGRRLRNDLDGLMEAASWFSPALETWARLRSDACQRLIAIVPPSCP